MILDFLSTWGFRQQKLRRSFEAHEMDEKIITHACFAPMGQGRDFSLSCVTNLLPRRGIDVNKALMINDDTFNLPKSAKRMKATHDWRFSPCFSVLPRVLRAKQSN